MSIEFRDLELIDAVARHGTITAAAEECGISQPAASMAVRRVERALGGRLFVRTRRGASTTTLGGEAVERARTLLAERDAMVWDLGRGAGSLRGGLRLGTTDAVSAYLLPDVYRTFRNRYPDVKLSVSVADSSTLGRSLLAAAIDLAVLTLPAPVGGISIRHAFSERMVPVLPPGADLPARRPLSGAEATDLPMIAYPARSVTRAIIDAGLRQAGASPTIAMEVSAPDVIVSLVASGLGFAVLPEHIASAAARSRQVVEAPIDGFSTTRRLGFAALDGAHLPPAARALVELAEELGTVPSGEAWTS